MSLQVAPVSARLNDVPVDAAVAAQPIAEDRVSHRWSAATRIGFRFAFCYIAAWCFLNGNATVWDVLPVIGDKVQDFVSRIVLLPAQFLAQHLFYVAPPGNQIHPTGSGDTAISWIAHLLLAVLALLATAVWSVLDRHRPHYQTLAAWLRFLVRMTLGFGMVTYGIIKIIPMQMPGPSMASLSEPLGMHSPMAMLWTFIGLNPWYESVCGGAEFLAGMLLLFRRTALSGALFTAFVAANVVLYNMFFDVPVKLYSGHLLLLALFLVLPDARALFRFFWLHQPAAPTGVWVPPASRAWFRRATVAIEIGFAVLTVGGTAFQTIPAWLKQRTEARLPCAHCSEPPGGYPLLHRGFHWISEYPYQR